MGEANSYLLGAKVLISDSRYSLQSFCLSTGIGQGWPGVCGVFPPFRPADQVPGLKPEDIQISVQGNLLTISGEKKKSVEEKKESHHHVERRYGTFRREITLSSAVDPEKIQAEYHEGVLTVTMPKTQLAKPKRVPVKS